MAAAPSRFPSLTFAAVSLAAVLAACDRGPAVAGSSGKSLAVAAQDPWRGPRLSEFTLTERSGEPVSLSDLRGRPFVLDFVFTTCAGPCPVLSANMARLQDELSGTGVRLVTITVDPKTDDPAALRAYAERFGADPERWLFLTGEEATIHRVMADLALAVQRDTSGEAPAGFAITHATRFVVVDAEGVAAGYYDGEDPDGVRRAAARARHLERPAGG